MTRKHTATLRRRRSAQGQRLLALLVFVVLGCLIWLAHTGRYDREVGRVAEWMRVHWQALVD